MTDRTYRDQVDPIKADKTGRVIQPTTLRRQRIELSVALVDQPFRVNGDFLYADSNSTGVATIKLNNTSEDPIPFLSQAAVENLPIKDVFLSCASQPGLVLNLWYGYQARIRPPQATVVVTASPVTLAGAPQGADRDALSAFSGLATGGPNAGVAGASGIANPAGSGTRLYIDAVTVKSTLVDPVISMQGALATSLNNQAGWESNAQLGGAVPVVGVGLLRGAPAALTAPLSRVLRRFSVEVAQKEIRHVFARPFILDPGRGLFVIGSILNSEVSSAWEGREYGL